VVDVDLEKFFDRVNHDVLMGLVAARITDPRLRTLIRRYLNAGMLANGVVMERHEGTPQGGPLSPLLANVLLDVVDQELERREHRFVRYADDCNVYVQSKRAADREMIGVTRLYAQLKLTVNTAKSAVAPAWTRSFVGFARAALGLIKEEIIGGDPERDGETFDGLKRGLAGAGLVAMDLDDMDARELAQSLLGQAGWLRLPGDLSGPSALRSIFPCRRRLGHALGTPGKSREFAQLVGMTD